MPKTLPPGVAETAGGRFVLAVKPDVFDGRDLEYRPQLHPLPPVMDTRGTDHMVLTQEGNSCTGHAIAAMINTVLAAGPNPILVSPYMLYCMARRYDEFEGSDDAGSSLRGALKGWLYHGVVSATDWPDLEHDLDIDRDPVLSAQAMQYPLGAFYRVNAFRLDDLQSAVNELRAIAVSAQVHSGWLDPAPVERPDGTTLYLIEKTAESTYLGGHAFAIVGYNDVGFLVQNSWGSGWGRNGFATLSYQDWLTSAYDAWVARPGVPASVNLRNITQVVTTTSGVVSQGPGPDLDRLQGHVVESGQRRKTLHHGPVHQHPGTDRLHFRADEGRSRTLERRGCGIRKRAVGASGRFLCAWRTGQRGGGVESGPGTAELVDEQPRLSGVLCLAERSGRNAG